MRPLTFLYRKFNSQQLLLKAFCDIIVIYGSSESYNESTFPFQRIISNVSVVGTLQLHSWKIEINAHWLFCRKFYARQLLFKTFFDLIGIFGSVEPLGGGETCAHWLFYRKFHFQPLIWSIFLYTRWRKLFSDQLCIAEALLFASFARVPL